MIEEYLKNKNCTVKKIKIIKNTNSEVDTKDTSNNHPLQSDAISVFDGEFEN